MTLKDCIERLRNTLTSYAPNPITERIIREILADLTHIDISCGNVGVYTVTHPGTRQEFKVTNAEAASKLLSLFQAHVDAVTELAKYSRERKIAKIMQLAGTLTDADMEVLVAMSEFLANRKR